MFSRISEFSSEDGVAAPSAMSLVGLETGDPPQLQLLAAASGGTAGAAEGPPAAKLRRPTTDVATSPVGGGGGAPSRYGRYQALK